MKKTIFSLLFLMASALFVNAQEQMFNKADGDLNVGIGFGNSWVGGGYSTRIPTIAASFDYGLRDDWGSGVFGVGAYLGASMYKYSYSAFFTSVDYNLTNIAFGGRASYHYTFVDNLDTYGGVILGFKSTFSSAAGSSTNVDLLDVLYVGAKYYFSDSFAAFSELAYGYTYFTIGATLKF